MEKKKGYTGIDAFRLAAAFLVIAIHTSPLASLNETGDFVLTRIIARLAVPFFFVTSGFFLITHYTCNAKRLFAFTKKTLCIYGAAILMYIPINIYNDYFAADDLLPSIVKDLVFDGTMYHLWYLPAAVLGAAIAWLCVTRLDYKRALAVTAALYAVGLFGDSYYGIAELAPAIKGLYGQLFLLSDYTRNGVFFAPIFFVLGGFIAESAREQTLAKSVRGFAVSLSLMLAEAMLLHSLDVQRHDSMYLLLPVCVYFLFHMLLHVRGKRLKKLGTVSLLIYLIHPMMIVVIRMLAKALKLQELLVENSIAHFLAVSALSVLCAALAVVLWEKCKPHRAKHKKETQRAYIEINRDNLEHNVKVLQNEVPPGCELMAVVKTEAYGHGAFAVAAHLDKIGVKAFAVATIDEGIRLRQYGIRGGILILGYTDVGRAAELKRYDLTQTLISYAYANALNRQRVRVKAHIKIDTGMHRLGIADDETVAVKRIFAMKYIQVCGMFTHLCCADSLRPDDVRFTREQIGRFYHLTDILKDSKIELPKLHVQSSYGLLNYPELRCDYVRVGIALYGVLSRAGEETVRQLDLQPVLSLKARVVLIRQVKRGESVGYGRCFTAERDSRIAILAIGYGDGLPRQLSCGTGYAVINGKRAPIVGKICMDQLAADITEIEDVRTCDVAVLFGAGEPDALSAPEAAADCGSISNELLCRLGARLPVVCKQESG